MEIEEIEVRQVEEPVPSHVALMAGGVAGTSVDIALFPIDTIKTRLQSEAGFFKSGGFRGIYSGLGSAALGSAPTAAIFFYTYEGLKKTIGGVVSEKYHPFVHMLAASASEVTACGIRVPVEVIKQRAQTNIQLSSVQVLRMTIRQELLMSNGFFFQIPFSFIQMPAWEILKKYWSRKRGRLVTPWESAVCGAIAGGFSAALTTPFDVAKTRIMLAEDFDVNKDNKQGSTTAKSNIFQVLQKVGQRDGVRGLFAGIVPRTIWISVGGCIFFGIYEKSKSLLQ
ncbi:mitochondrial S-adenosylmethionine carrier protein-like [Saccoglossus kowalevskii]